MNSVISFISYHFLAQHHPLPIVCLSGTFQLPRALASILAAYNAAYSKNPHELLLLLHIFALHVPLSMTACLTLLFISHFLPFSVFVFFFFSVSLLENVNAMEAEHILAVLTSSKFSIFVFLLSMKGYMKFLIIIGPVHVCMHV